MFVAFALQNTRGKDTEPKELVPAGADKSEVVIATRHDDVSNVVIEARGEAISAPPTLWQFVSKIVNALEGAFNDPSLIEYGKQQGTDISEFLTTPCPNTSSQPLKTAKPRSSHSIRSSSSY
jgi:hypothetical protein